VAFADVLIGDDMRLGEIGAGWGQNTAELALERGGAERWMSVAPVLERWAARMSATAPPGELADLGSVAARCWAFHGLSLSIARMVDQGASPTMEAALAKEMATRFEQECIQIAARHYGRLPDLNSPDEHESLLARAILVGPSWTIRGGTTEILRTIIAKELSRSA
jgi:3-oxocholest-4-en-26-oyl-CoA dehydrogenase alpha subunit